jgi:hypothetical protein
MALSLQFWDPNALLVHSLSQQIPFLFSVNLHGSLCDFTWFSSAICHILLSIFYLVIHCDFAWCFSPILLGASLRFSPIISPIFHHLDFSLSSEPMPFKKK